MTDEERLREVIEKDAEDRKEIKFLVDNGIDPLLAVRTVISTHCVICRSNHRSKEDMVFKHRVIKRLSK